MNDKLQVFSYEGAEIRTVQQNGETWWVAKDVCDVFGETNRNRAMQALDEDEKGYTQMTTPGGIQPLAVVNESGLYSLLFAMQPAKARGVSDEYIAEREMKLRKFKRWVTHDVLPSIRKYGLYAVDEVLANPDILITALQELKAERERSRELQLTAAVQKQQIAELQPKASYYDLILQNKNTVPITQIAKDYGMSGRAFNALLHELGVQYKLRGTWLLYQDYANCGYTQSRTHAIDAERSVMHTYWTQKGRLFLYDLLKSERGILPSIERGAA